MARYIDADAVVKNLDCGNLDASFSERDIVDMIESRPTADVREVVHGEWRAVDTTSTSRQCSACGFVFGDVRMITQSPSTTIIEHDYNFAFCLMCGADMRGGNDGN